MTPEQVLDHPAKVLSDAQRRSYFDTGYLQLDSFVSEEWLDRLWAVTDRFVEDSRSKTGSDEAATPFCSGTRNRRDRLSFSQWSQWRTNNWE